MKDKKISERKKIAMHFIIAGVYLAGCVSGREDRMYDDAAIEYAKKELLKLF